MSERIDAQIKAISISSSGNKRTVDKRDGSSLCLSVSACPSFDAPVQRRLVHENEPVNAFPQFCQTTVESGFLVGDDRGTERQRLHDHRLVRLEVALQVVVQLASRTLHTYRYCISFIRPPSIYVTGRPFWCWAFSDISNTQTLISQTAERRSAKSTFLFHAEPVKLTPTFRHPSSNFIERSKVSQFSTPVDFMALWFRNNETHLKSET